jgi:hypothetical protein
MQSHISVCAVQILPTPMEEVSPNLAHGVPNYKRFRKTPGCSLGPDTDFVPYATATFSHRTADAEEFLRWALKPLSLSLSLSLSPSPF